MIWEAYGGAISCWRGVRRGAVCPQPRRRAPGSRWVSSFDLKEPHPSSIPENFAGPATLQFPHGRKGFRLGRGPGLPSLTPVMPPDRVGWGRTFGVGPDLLGHFLDPVPRDDRPNPSPARSRSHQAIGWKIPALGSRDGADAWAARFWVTWRHSWVGVGLPFIAAVSVTSG
jgi:hypothetical protein